MNVSRFVGATSREAMRQVRMALGSEALIISNKRVNGGVEIIATDSTDVPLAQVSAPVVPAPNPATTAAPVSNSAYTPPQTPVTPSASQEVMSAIESLKGSLEGRIEEVMWSNQLRANPDLLSLFQSLLAYGFSVALLRAMLKRLPANLSSRAAMQWVRQELDTHLPVLKDEDHLWQAGLALALVGPTGVGKTTTIAKLAARAVRKFGADNVVLITTDSYRIGAHEQLKIYARLMGVKVHAVQKPQELQTIVLSLRSDQVILIDNVGVSQRDKYVQDQSLMLANAGRPIKRLLVLNAASHGDTLDEVARIYRKEAGPSLVGCIVSKVDEANRLGAALDVALRYQLPVHYVSDGQRVPENLRHLTSNQLVDMALSQNANNKTLFAPTTADLAALISATQVQEQARAQADAGHTNILQQILALTSLSNEEISIEELRHAAALVDESAFGSAAYDLWRDSKREGQQFDLAQRAATHLRDSVLEITNIAPTQPVMLHHVRQRLGAKKTQLYALAVGSSDGSFLAMPLLQLKDQTSWYANCGVSQRVTEKSSATLGRFELELSMQWAKENSPPSALVHWVEEHNNQLWQKWQNEQTNVMALVAPSTRCWHVNGHSTPAAIAKQLPFQALDKSEIPLPYRLVSGQGSEQQSFWYAQAPVELHARSGETVRLQLHVLQCLDTESLAEIKTYYAFGLLGQQLNVTPERIAAWVLQHTEGKSLLRFVGRAYPSQALRNFVKQEQLSHGMSLELAAILGGAAWELDQCVSLNSINRLLLALSGQAALSQTQIASSLLRLFNLKSLLQQYKP